MRYQRERRKLGVDGYMNSRSTSLAVLPYTRRVLLHKVFCRSPSWITGQCLHPKSPVFDLALSTLPYRVGIFNVSTPLALSCGISPLSSSCADLLLCRPVYAALLCGSTRKCTSTRFSPSMTWCRCVRVPYRVRTKPGTYGSCASGLNERNMLQNECAIARCVHH